LIRRKTPKKARYTRARAHTHTHSHVLIVHITVKLRSAKEEYQDSSFLILQFLNQFLNQQLTLLAVHTSFFEPRCFFSGKSHEGMLQLPHVGGGWQRALPLPLHCQRRKRTKAPPFFVRSITNPLTGWQRALVLSAMQRRSLLQQGLPKERLVCGRVDECVSVSVTTSEQAYFRGNLRTPYYTQRGKSRFFVSLNTLWPFVSSFHFLFV